MAFGLNRKVRPVRVQVVTPLGRGGQGGIDRIMDEIRIRLAVDPPKDMTVDFVTSRGQGHITLSPLFVIWILVRSFGKLLGMGPDVQHINLSSKGSTYRKLMIARAARLAGVPYVIHLHGSGFDTFWDGSGPVLSGQIEAMFSHAAGVFVLGSTWWNYICKKVPNIAERIVVLPNATSAAPPPAAKLPGAPVEIVFLGRLGARKGVPQLVEALGRLAEDRTWRAVIAGDGDIDQTRDAVRAAGIADRVELPGWVGPDKVHELLERADVLVLPSFEENLPMSVIEGMAFGLAIVTTPVGATEDIIRSEETGLLVPPGDAVALAQAIGRLVGDAELRSRLGASARAFHAANLEISGYVKRLVELWRLAAHGGLTAGSGGRP